MKASLILLDLGNTNIKVGLARPGMDLACYTLPTAQAGTADSLGLALAGVAAHAECDPMGFEGAVACSVVPSLDPVVGKAVERFFGVEPAFVPGHVPLPLENRYQRPGEVGADRLVAAYAARRFHEQGNLIVVDFGTATTFDCISGNAYLGGLICPGVLSSAGALARGTAKLPQVDLEVDPEALEIGRSTADSLNQGLVFGFAAMVDGLAARLKARLGGRAHVTATGGLAARIARLRAEVDEVRENLLMEGLMFAWEERERD